MKGPGLNLGVQPIIDREDSAKHGDQMPLERQLRDSSRSQESTALLGLSELSSVIIAFRRTGDVKGKHGTNGFKGLEPIITAQCWAAPLHLCCGQWGQKELN